MAQVHKLLYTIQEVCEATAYSRSFVYARIAAAELRVVRIGRTIRVAEADLREWIGRAGK